MFKHQILIDRVLLMLGATKILFFACFETESFNFGFYKQKTCLTGESSFIRQRLVR